MNKVSILMSTYNGERYIEEQLKSIFNQNYTDFQLVIRDDGSSDDTVSIIEKFIEDYPSKIILYRGENIGVKRSFWELIQNAPDSSYFAFCDQDDIWPTNKLYNAILKLENYPLIPSCYFSNGKLVDNNLNSLHRNIYKRYSNIQRIFEKFENIICYVGAVGCTMVFNNILRNYILNKDFPKGMIMHDVFLLSVCASIDGKIIYDESENIYYRQHSSNTIGCKPGLLNALKYRITYLFEKKDSSIKKQAIYILNEFDNQLSENKKEFLKLVSKYTDSIFYTLKLSFNKSLTFSDWKTELFIRLTILFGKR